MIDRAADDILQNEAHFKNADFERINDDDFMTVFRFFAAATRRSTVKMSKGPHAFFGQMEGKEGTPPGPLGL